MKCSRN